MEFDFLNKKRWWPQDVDYASTIIIAATDISAGVTSLPFVSTLNLRRSLLNKPITSVLKVRLIKQLLSSMDISQHIFCNNSNFLQASVNQNGKLTIEKHVDWVPLLSIADNCEDKNLEAEITPFADAIILRTTKFIAAGVELKVWFSNDLLSFLEIPFLTPLNIVSHELYKCVDCGTSFNQPNPLKIHLAFACRVRHPSNESDNTASIKSETFCTQGRETISLVSRDRNPTKEPKTHICMFCGKLYTRKYGLKIHLRTHTGHKPLQCRFCGRPFSDPSNLNKHIRLHAHHSTHLAGGHHKCPECGKIMIRRRDLDRHLKTRHR